MAGAIQVISKPAVCVLKGATATEAHVDLVKMGRLRETANMLSGAGFWQLAKKLAPGTYDFYREDIYLVDPYGPIPAVRLKGSFFSFAPPVSDLSAFFMRDQYPYLSQFERHVLFEFLFAVTMLLTPGALDTRKGRIAYVGSNFFDIETAVLPKAGALDMIKARPVWA